MATARRTGEAIEASDHDELIRIVADHCRTRDWPALLELRTLLAHAGARGKELWGVDAHVRYRLALEAPAELAAAAVLEGPARFALGPLTEVAANRHTFAELEAHLPPGPERLQVAAERVVAGETIGDDSMDATRLELPLALQPWEPSYSLPRYQADRVESHPPPLPSLSPIDLSDPGVEVDDPEGTRAMLALVSAWVEESNGRADARCVEGDAGSAVRSLGPSRARMAAVAPATAVAWMAWAAASGGAHGRRRGGAAGRAAAWWVISSLGDLDWPADPEQAAGQVARLRWYAWSDLAPPTGWNLGLAIEDRDEGLAWALSGLDSA